MNELINVLRISVNPICVVALIFIMSNFKCSIKTAWRAYFLITVLAFAANTLIYWLWGRPAMMRWFAVITAVPCLIALLILTKDHFPQLFFNFFTAVNALYLVSIAGLSVASGPEGHVIVDILVRLVLYGIILFLFQRYFSSPYHFLAEHMKRGWWSISLIPFLFFCMVMFLGLYPTVRHDNYPVVILLYVVLCLVYIVIYQVFQNTYARITQENNGKMLMVQLEMQKQSIEQMRMLRHDYRHYIGQIDALLQAGKLDQARQYTRRFEEEIQRTQIPDYCENTMLNAVFAFYLEPAKRSHIQVETHLNLPEMLTVDEIELSIVIANALENAVQACEKMPADAPRKIQIQGETEASLVVEIINTYTGTIVWGKNGLPTTAKKGHGIGTQRIAAFLRKYHAVCDCEASDGLFRLRLLIPPQENENRQRKESAQ